MATEAERWRAKATRARAKASAATEPNEADAWRMLAKSADRKAEHADAESSVEAPFDPPEKDESGAPQEWIRLEPRRPKARRRR